MGSTKTWPYCFTFVTFEDTVKLEMFAADLIREFLGYCKNTQLNSH